MFTLLTPFFHMDIYSRIGSGRHYVNLQFSCLSVVVIMGILGCHYLYLKITWGSFKKCKGLDPNLGETVSDSWGVVQHCDEPNFSQDLEPLTSNHAHCL